MAYAAACRPLDMHHQLAEKDNEGASCKGVQITVGHKLSESFVGSSADGEKDSCTHL